MYDLESLHSDYYELICLRCRLVFGRYAPSRHELERPICTPCRTGRGESHDTKRRRKDAGERRP